MINIEKKVFDDEEIKNFDPLFNENLLRGAIPFDFAFPTDLNGSHIDFFQELSKDTNVNHIQLLNKDNEGKKVLYQQFVNVGSLPKLRQSMLSNKPNFKYSGEDRTNAKNIRDILGFNAYLFDLGIQAEQVDEKNELFIEIYERISGFYDLLTFVTMLLINQFHYKYLPGFINQKIGIEKSIQKTFKIVREMEKQILDAIYEEYKVIDRDAEKTFKEVKKTEDPIEKPKKPTLLKTKKDKSKKKENKKKGKKKEIIEQELIKDEEIKK